MKKIATFLIAPLLFLLAFTATSFAAAGASEDGSLLDYAKPVLDAVMSGNYAYAAALALVLVAAVARKYGAKHWSFLATDAGGALIVLLASFGGALATTTAAGAWPSLAMVWVAAKVAAMAAGGWSLVKKILIDPLRPWASRQPAWIQAVFAVITWVFDKPDPIADAIAKGEAALAANPSTGAPGVGGVPRDVR